MRNFFVNLFTFGIHAFKILRSFRIHTDSSSSSAKNLFKDSFILIFSSINVFLKMKFICKLAIKQKLICVFFVHLITIFEPFSLIHNNIIILKVLLGGIYGKLVVMKNMVNKIKIKRNWRMTAFDLRLPSKFHVRHQACS